ncbi:hypothetical protein CN572_19200 [Bacillus wiedmannii]|uniref:hypothetical protein n=1 Tax=Bacillus wiedmannii TaxID=1890302 RepID=UPI000BEF73D8|nr:hypothetical protein [Bacillus wiedmannii]PEO71140.1 hypothetical protein CN572_19200 [Bacillus wiedmannii]
MRHEYWSLRVYTNPGVIGWNIGGHFGFFNSDFEGDTYVPHFTSPHVNILNNNETSKIYARLTTLLRLVNGIRVLQNRLEIGASRELYFHHGMNTGNRSYSEDLDTFLKELENPFDEEILSKLEKRDSNSNRNVYEDYFQLIVDEPLVREVVILLSLSEEQILYLLINTYKIFENMRSDLKVKPKLETNETNLPESLFNALKKINEHNNYINSREASGILCRHGEKFKAPKEASTLEDIRKDTIHAINEWMNYKCISKFGRDYNPQPVSDVDPFDKLK